MKKSGNAAAVQRQLGHSNVVYSLQYARIPDEELPALLDERYEDTGIELVNGIDC